MKNLDLNKIHQKVCSLLEPASQIAFKYFNKNTAIITKSVQVSEGSSFHSVNDVLTAADKEVEDYFRTNLKQWYPDVGFIGEESKQADIKKYNWIIDPIDGTLNFIWGVPIWCHSIALWKENEPVYGAVYLPFMKQTVYAIKNKGLFVNGQKIKWIDNKKKEKWILHTLVGDPKERKAVVNAAGKIISPFRHYGSTVYHGVLACLDSSFVTVVNKNGLWDLAAIVLFAKEAGLYVEFITSKPSIYDKDLKSYKHSLVMGEKNLTTKIASHLRKLTI